jgi:hypothetical protein
MGRINIRLTIKRAHGWTLPEPCCYAATAIFGHGPLHRAGSSAVFRANFSGKTA